MSGWVTEMLLATSVLVLLVLLIRRPVARIFGPRASYALWLAPAARAILPPLPRSEGLALELTMLPGAPAVSAPASAPTMLDWLVPVWVAGFAAVFCWRIAQHMLFMRRTLRDARQLAIAGCSVEVVESPAVSMPVAAGLLRRRILLPPGIESTIGREQMRLAVEHEQQHHRRGDLWAVAFAEMLFAAHWFNPLVPFVRKAFRFDLETACDADVMDRVGQVQREEYARTIVRCAAAPAPATLCALTTVHDLKRRLTMLKTRHSIGRRLAGTTLAASFAAGGMLLTLGAAPTAAQETTSAGERIMVREIGPGGDIGALEEMMKARYSGLEQCEADKVQIGSGGTAGGQKDVRILICGKNGLTPAEQRAAIERVIERTHSAPHLNEKQKAQGLAALRAKLAELPVD